MLDTTPHALNYAPRTRGLWGRRVLSLALIALAIGIAPSVARLVPKLRVQYAWAMWQRKAIAYEAPVGFVVYDDDPAEARKLLRVSGYQTPSGYVASSDPSWRAVGYLPEPLRNPKHGWVCNLYVHERHSARGARWMTMVGTQLQSVPGGRIIQIYAFSRPVVSVLPDLNLDHDRCAHGSSLQFQLRDQDHLRIFGGRNDVDDPSRFTIAYELNGDPGVIEGIESDGCRLRIIEGALGARLLTPHAAR